MARFCTPWRHLLGGWAFADFSEAFHFRLLKYKLDARPVGRVYGLLFSFAAENKINGLAERFDQSERPDRPFDSN